MKKARSPYGERASSPVGPDIPTTERLWGSGRYGMLKLAVRCAKIAIGFAVAS